MDDTSASKGSAREWWAVAGKPAHRLGQHRVALRMGVERRQVELEAEELPYDRLDPVVQRLDVHALGHR